MIAPHLRPTRNTQCPSPLRAVVGYAEVAYASGDLSDAAPARPGRRGQADAAFIAAVQRHGRDIKRIAAHIGKAESTARLFFSRNKDRLGLDDVVRLHTAGTHTALHNLSTLDSGVFFECRSLLRLQQVRSSSTARHASYTCAQLLCKLCVL